MLEKYLKDALMFEEKGYKLYTELARESKNELSKKLFGSLAEQELYHIDQIKSYLSGNQLEVKNIKFDSLEKSIHKLFNELGKDMIGKDFSQVAGIKKALQMEKEGYANYKAAYDSTEKKEDKKFLQNLMDMENEHYESLSNLYYYYTGNDQWLSEDESKTWNWMNL